MLIYKVLLSKWKMLPVRDNETICLDKLKIKFWYFQRILREILPFGGKIYFFQVMTENIYQVAFKKCLIIKTLGMVQ